MALIHAPNTLTLWLLQIDMGPAVLPFKRIHVKRVIDGLGIPEKE